MHSLPKISAKGDIPDSHGDFKNRTVHPIQAGTTKMSAKGDTPGNLSFSFQPDHPDDGHPLKDV